MERKPPYKPTRTCPHPWCKPLHLAPAPFALAVIAFDLWHNWVNLLLITFGVVAANLATKLVYFKARPRSGPATVKDVVQDIRESPSALDLEMEDAKYEGTGWRMLEVRKGWARIAVGCDIALLLGVGWICTLMIVDPDEQAKRADDVALDVSGLASLAIAVAFIAFTVYAHKKATKPRKPKRAWLPAFLRTNV